MPGHHHPVDGLGADPALLQRVGPRLGTQGDVAVLPEALLPQLAPAPRPARASGRRTRRSLCAGHVLGQQRAPPVGIADQEGGAGVAAPRLVGAPRQPVATIGRDHQDRARPGQRRLQGAHPRAQRTAEVVGRDPALLAERGVDGGGVGLVVVRRGGGGEPQGVGGRRRRRPQGQPGRLGAHCRRVLVVRGDRPGAPAPAGAQEVPDLGPVEAPERHIASGTGDPAACSRWYPDRPSVLTGRQLGADRAGTDRPPPSDVPVRSPAGAARPLYRQPMADVTSRSPLQGTVAAVAVAPGDLVGVGDRLVVLESMKMEHPVVADRAGTVRSVSVGVGDNVDKDDPLVVIAEAASGASAPGSPGQGSSPGDRGERATPSSSPPTRPELAELERRQALLRDEARPEAVARRHSHGHRTARENLDDLCDPGTFVEYGALAVAAQRAPPPAGGPDRPAPRPTASSAASAGSTATSSIRRGAPAAPCSSYDYTVLAGTQGQMNHRKKDRLFELAERLRLPVVLFAEGGGGRPGDTDGAAVSGLDAMAFALFGRLSGLVPLVGVVSGRCFAGNAALLGCCDVIIATADASIGMAGPAMIEGGGLGGSDPDEVGPVGGPGRQRRDRRAGRRRGRGGGHGQAVPVLLPGSGARAGRRRPAGPAPDCVPEDRRRVYDVRKAVTGLADDGLGARAAGRVRPRDRHRPGPHRGPARSAWSPTTRRTWAGAIDADGADKAARFMQLCDAFDLPVCSSATPRVHGRPRGGADRPGPPLRRHVRGPAPASRVPFVTVVLRKGYGLGAQAMAGRQLPGAGPTVAWPTGEIGGMGLEGAVRLGFRKELEAEDPDERAGRLRRHGGAGLPHGKALNAATHFEIDDVIDPADTRAPPGPACLRRRPAAALGRREAPVRRHLVRSGRVTRLSCCAALVPTRPPVAPPAYDGRRNLTGSQVIPAPPRRARRSARHGLRVLARSSRRSPRRWRPSSTTNDDPDVFDVTRENMAQIVDTPEAAGLHGRARREGLAGHDLAQGVRRLARARASTSTCSTSSWPAGAAPRSARASASSARP